MFGVIKVADVPDASGVVYPSDALKKIADGVRFHWIEETKSLVYGELVDDFGGVDIDAVQPALGAEGKMNMESTEDRIRKLIYEQLGVPESELKRETKIVEDLGADSLDRVELVMAIEDVFELEIPDEEAEPLRTVGEVIDYVEKRTARTTGA